MTVSGKHDLGDRPKASFGVTGRAHSVWRGDQLDFGRMITAWCAAMAEAGVTTRQQVEVLWAMGLSIGQGGTGPDQQVPECPYCGCHGGGGHGGFCPNMDLKPEDWVSARR